MHSVSLCRNHSETKGDYHMHLVNMYTVYTLLLFLILSSEEYFDRAKLKVLFLLPGSRQCRNVLQNKLVHICYLVLSLLLWRCLHYGDFSSVGLCNVTYCHIGRCSSQHRNMTWLQSNKNSWAGSVSRISYERYIQLTSSALVCQKHSLGSNACTW